MDSTNEIYVTDYIEPRINYIQVYSPEELLEQIPKVEVEEVVVEIREIPIIEIPIRQWRKMQKMKRNKWSCDNTYRQRACLSIYCLSMAFLMVIATLIILYIYGPVRDHRYS